MQAGYFETAWNDIKNSPGWFGKLCIFALLMFIPVVGPILGGIVLMGYAYGWARDIAWNIHAPMPARIFGNEDGKLYSRGFFSWLIAFIFALVPAIISGVFGAFAGLAAGGDGTGGVAAFFGMLGGLAGVVLSVIAVLFAWVGIMRMSIYGRLSPGLQVSKIWKMIRQDVGGLLRILGMIIVVSLIGGIVLSIIGFVVMLIVGSGAVMSIMNSGLINDLMYSNPNSLGEAELMRLLGAMGPSVTLFVFFGLVLGFFSMVLSIFTSMLSARALGYWTRQFQVAQWRSQDEPMPFEYTDPAAQAAAAAGAAEARTYVYGGQHDYGQAQAASAYEQAAAQAAQPGYRAPEAAAASSAAAAGAAGAAVGAATVAGAEAAPAAAMGQAPGAAVGQATADAAAQAATAVEAQVPAEAAAQAPVAEAQAPAVAVEYAEPVASGAYEQAAAASVQAVESATPVSTEPISAAPAYVPDTTPHWVREAQGSVEVAEADQAVTKVGAPGQDMVQEAAGFNAPDEDLAPDFYGNDPAEPVAEVAAEVAPGPVAEVAAEPVAETAPEPVAEPAAAGADAPEGTESAAPEAGEALSPLDELRRIIAEEDAKVAEAAGKVAAITTAADSSAVAAGAPADPAPADQADGGQTPPPSPYEDLADK